MNAGRHIMRKAYAVADFLSEDNKEQMRKTSSAAGYEIIFYEDAESASGNVSDGEVLYSGGDAAICREMPNLRWCQTAFAGIGSYVASGLFGPGKALLSNGSGSYGRTISEHIIMVSLMLMRQMPVYFDAACKKEWGQDVPMRSIAGSDVVIVGTGDIGSETAAKFKALGAKCVTGFNRSGRTADAFDVTYLVSEFDRVFSEKDFSENVDLLVLCAPGTQDSRGLLSRERIELLAEKTYVINIGRGVLIDQDALIEDLNSERIAGAALDVMMPEPLPDDHPLWDAKNCIITPHVSGNMSLPYTVDRTVEIFCENMKRFSEGKELINLADVKRGY